EGVSCGLARAYSRKTCRKRLRKSIAPSNRRKNGVSGDNREGDCCCFESPYRDWSRGTRKRVQNLPPTRAQEIGISCAIRDRAAGCLRRPAHGFRLQN